MAKIEGRPKVTMMVSISLSEEEACALDALVGYGVNEFLKVFYEKMGRAYLQPHEAGLRSLFDSVQHGEASVSYFLFQARKAREVFNGTKVAVAVAPPALHDSAAGTEGGA